MTRVTVTPGSWFDLAKAERWDDRDEIANTGCRGAGRGDAILRTAGGEWVLEHWTDWGGEAATYEYVTADMARDWLMREGFTGAVDRCFPGLPDERGPGRPEIGNRVSVALGDLRPRIDAARKDGETLSEAIRRLIAAGLDQQS